MLESETAGATATAGVWAGCSMTGARTDATLLCPPDGRSTNCFFGLNLCQGDLIGQALSGGSAYHVRNLFARPPVHVAKPSGQLYSLTRTANLAERDHDGQRQDERRQLGRQQKTREQGARQRR